MPPIDTSVSQPWVSASGIRYSSLRVLLPPKAKPLLLLALGVEIDLAAQMRAQALQWLDWCGAESQRMAGEALKVHGGCSWSSGRRACIVDFIVAGDHWNGTDVTGSAQGNSVLQCS